MIRRQTYNTRFVAAPAGKKPQRKGDYGREKLSMDNGERYEVRYRDGLNAWHIWTWTDDQAVIDDALEAINAHPIFHSPRVIDRERKRRAA